MAQKKKKKGGAPQPKRKPGLSMDQFIPEKKDVKTHGPYDLMNNLLVVFLPVIAAVAYTLAFPYFAQGQWPANHAGWALLACGLATISALLNYNFDKKGLYPKANKPLVVATLVFVLLSILCILLDAS